MTIHMPKTNTSNNEGGGGGKVKEVVLLSITTAPTGEFAKGSKYYNLTDKKIYTAVVANSWDGATVDDPQFGTYYLYDNSTYVWDGDSLEKYNLEDFIPKTDIVNDLKTADATKVLSAEQGKVLDEKVELKQNITDNNLTTTTKTIVGAINELNNDKQNITDNSLTTTSKTVIGAINELNTEISLKQNITDNNLTTNAKTIVEAINELDSDKQDKTDNNLITTDKTIVGAINELDNDKQDKTDNNLITTSKTVVEAINELNTEVDTKNPILEVDNTINENSYNVVSNKGIAEGIKANTTTVVDDVVDVLPTADTLDKKVLLTTDNKIYKAVKEKVINSAYSITGNLTIDSKGNISGFSDTNYLTLISQYWYRFFPIKLRVVFDMISSVEVPFLQLFRNDNNSLLFSLTVYSGVASNDRRFVAKVYDSNGDVIESQTFSLAKNFNFDSVFEIKIQMNRIDIFMEGTFLTTLFLSKLNTSLISYDVAGTIKLSNMLFGGYPRGIANIDGLNSSIYKGSFTKNEYKLAVDKSGNNFVWQEELTCQKGSKIIDLATGQILVYNNNIWNPVADIPVIDINSLSKLNSLLTSIHSKLCINITSEFSNNYNPEFTFKEGLAVMMIQTPQKATIVGAGFSAYYTDGNWVGTNTNIEEITFGTVSGGFDSYLRLNDLQLNSTDKIIHLFQDEELYIDLGPNWETNFNQSFYMYCQPFGFIVNGQATQRYYVVNNRAGRIRLACKTDANFSEVKVYKRKNINFIKTELRNDISFNAQTILFYGDSIAAGYTNSTPAKVDNPYPHIFLTAVNAVDAENSNKSISGSSYTNINGRTKLLDTIRGNDPDNPADITSTHIFIAGGINDFAEQIEPNVFRDAVRETFDYIHEHNLRASVFIISPLNINTSISTWQKTYKVDVYRNILEQESYRYGFYYINGAEFPLPIQSSSLYTDNLHINQTAHNIVGLQLLYKLTKDITYNNDILFLHNSEMMSLKYTGKTTTDGKLIYKYTLNTQNKDITNIINILQFTGIQVSKIYMLSAYGYAGDASYRVPLGWISNANVDYYFSAHLGVNGDISYHLPTANYTNFEITFEFWME